MYNIYFFYFTQLRGTFLCVNFASKVSSLRYTSVVQCNLIKCSVVQSRRVQCIVLQCSLTCSRLDQTWFCILSGMVKKLEFAHFALLMGCYLMYCMLLQCTERGYFQVQCSVVQWCQSDPNFFPSTLVKKKSHNQLKKTVLFFTFGHSNHSNFKKKVT